jgi:hypothetical protein
MVANTDIPKVIESTSYTATLAETKNPSDPIFLERALYLHEHGYFKELTTLELREKLRDVYRKSNEMRDILENEDVWK